MKNNLFELTGQTEEHLILFDKGKHLIHRDILSPFKSLVELCHENNFDLKIASSFRSFSRQKVIWEEKVNGTRPILDAFENKINAADLSDEDLLFSILNWSMIPGFSRHHFGSEIDIYDNSKIDYNFTVELTPSESEAGGPFYDFHHFLDTLIESGKSFDFYRPYDENSTGVKPERWHLSHKPTSQKYIDMLSLNVFEEIITSLEISLKEEILDNSKLIFEKYIKF